MIDLQPNLKRALAWRCLAELIRRHHDRHDLRIVELHPCGGFYDCLGLVLGRFEQTLCQFNIAGTSLLFASVLGPQRELPSFIDPSWGNLWRYPEAALSVPPREFVGAVEAQLGLPVRDTCATSTPSTITVSVIAELVSRYALAERSLELRCGWYDSSGMGGSHVADWAAQFPQAPSGASWQERAARVARLWRLHANEIEEPDVVADLATSQVFVGMKPNGAPLLERFNTGTGIRELAWLAGGLGKR